jgi:sugar/nucleoside kinase (ribokinase family)
MTKRKTKSAIAAAVEELQETGAPISFDPPFAVKRVVIELLEEWLPRHTVHAHASEVEAYLQALKGTAHAG